MTKINIKNTAILIPALNEELTIEKVVFNSHKIGVPIVIDDGSTDSTATLALNAGAYVISNDINIGYEASLNRGFKKAIELGFEFALTMDADGQHSIESSQLILQNSSDDFDIIIGTRKTKQRIIESLGGFIGKLIWDISDPFSGLKLYRIPSFSMLKNFNKLNLVGCELMIFAIVNNLIINSIVVDTQPRLDSPRFGNSFKANYKFLRALIIILLINFRLKKL